MKNCIHGIDEQEYCEACNPPVEGMEKSSEMEQRIAKILQEYGYGFEKSVSIGGHMVETTYSSGDFIYKTFDIEVD